MLKPLTRRQRAEAEARLTDQFGPEAFARQFGRVEREARVFVTSTNLEDAGRAFQIRTSRRKQVGSK